MVIDREDDLQAFSQSQSQSQDEDEDEDLQSVQKPKRKKLAAPRKTKRPRLVESSHASQSPRSSPRAKTESKGSLVSRAAYFDSMPTPVEPTKDNVKATIRRCEARRKKVLALSGPRRITDDLSGILSGKVKAMRPLQSRSVVKAEIAALNSIVRRNSSDNSVLLARMRLVCRGVMLGKGSKGSLAKGKALRKLLLTPEYEDGKHGCSLPFFFVGTWTKFLRHVNTKPSAKAFVKAEQKLA